MDSDTPPTVTAGAQDGLPHVVPLLTSWHPPLPLQLPVLPHGECGGHVVVSLGVPPDPILLQVPTLPVSLQLWHPLLQAELQQTPSTQLPLTQSVPAPHCCPLATFVPHLLLILRQVSPDVQSLSDVQAVRQDGLVALHLYGSHCWGCTAGQWPLPSQVPAGVNVAPVQLACRHPVLVDQGLQLPRPSHVPSAVQSPVVALMATQRYLGSGLPSGTTEQLPTLPETLQLTQRLPRAASLHAVSQHTPSVQIPLWHCPAEVQPAPFGFRPHELFTQVFGDTQSLSDLHTLRQARPLHTKVPHD